MNTDCQSNDCAQKGRGARGAGRLGRCQFCRSCATCPVRQRKRRRPEAAAASSKSAEAPVGREARGPRLALHCRPGNREASGLLLSKRCPCYRRLVYVACHHVSTDYLPDFSSISKRGRGGARLIKYRNGASRAHLHYPWGACHFTLAQGSARTGPTDRCPGGGPSRRSALGAAQEGPGCRPCLRGQQTPPSAGRSSRGHLRGGRQGRGRASARSRNPVSGSRGFKPPAVGTGALPGSLWDPAPTDLGSLSRSHIYLSCLGRAGAPGTQAPLSRSVAKCRMQKNRHGEERRGAETQRQHTGRSLVVPDPNPLTGKVLACGLLR